MINSKSIRQLIASVMVLLLSACGDEIVGPGGLHEYEDSGSSLAISENSGSRVADTGPYCSRSEIELPRGSIPEKNCGPGAVDPMKP